MPCYSISEGLANMHRSIDDLFESLFLNADFESGDSTQATFRIRTATFDVTGSGLMFSATTALEAGTVNSVL